MRKPTTFSKAESKYLSQNYTDISINKLTIQLRERYGKRVCKNSIKVHLFETLGLNENKRLQKKYTKQETQYLIKNIKLSKLELAENIGRSVDEIQRKIYALKLSPSTHKKYTTEEVSIITKYYRTHSHKEIGEMIGRSHWSVKHKLQIMGLKRTLEESKKIQERFSPMGHYKKGNKPKNTLYDGAVTIRKNYKTGHTRKHIRISEGEWKELQIYNWENKYGSIPKRMILACKTDDILNCNTENWELITMHENMERNRYSDGHISFLLSRTEGKGKGKYDKELKKEILKHPNIIELKRQQLLLNKEIKNHE